MVGVGRDTKSHPVSMSLVRDTFHQTTFLRSPSKLDLSTSMDGSAPPSNKVCKKNKYSVDKLRESFCDPGMCGHLL